MNELNEIYEIDSLDIAYQKLINDEKLLTMIDSASFFKYHIPKEFLEKPPLIRVTGYQTPTEYADGLQLGWDCIVQVDVWCDDDPFKIGMHINKLMKQLNFRQTGATPEFDPDTYLIRNGRIYRGTILADLSEVLKQNNN